MFRLYFSSTNDPVKFNIYSKIFNQEFNLSFFVPKKDQCDRCVAHGLATDETTKQTQAYLSHKHRLELTKAERDLDRANKEEFTAVVCYDLQNVFGLPRAPVSNFFYRRKFSVYNLTGHCSTNKVTYCAIWNEALSGRTGNDLATSLIKILDNVVSDNPTLRKIILWSDSCVPQNRNRVTTLAILKFMEAHPSLIEIQQKFSEPGHSQVQEIDAVHSTIERHLRNQDIYSPISLIKLLKSMEYAKVHLKLIQLKPNDFKNYNGASIGMNFPPFSSVCNLIYQNSNLSVIKYRKEYGNSETFTSVLIKNTRQTIKKMAFKLPTVNSSQFNYKMPPEKKKDLRSMLMYMPEVDKTFYNIYLN